MGMFVIRKCLPLCARREVEFEENVLNVEEAKLCCTCVM